MDGIVQQLVEWATGVVSTLGYFGVALLIALESIFPPIPSELILPLAGSLVARGEFNLLLAILAATAGSLIGALALYGVGRLVDEAKLGDWLDRHGKWLLLSRSDLEKSHEWFARHGRWGVLFARLVPGVRSVVSIPAGLINMELWQFAIFTATGSAIWNSLLILAGVYLGENWQQLESIMGPLSPIIYASLALAVLFFAARRIWNGFGPGKHKDDRDGSAHQPRRSPASEPELPHAARQAFPGGHHEPPPATGHAPHHEETTPSRREPPATPRRGAS